MKFRLLVAAFLFCLPLLGRAETTAATVHSVSGDASVTTPDGQSQRIVVNMTIPPGSTIHTDNGMVGLELVPGADTVIAAHTTVNVSTLEYSKDDSGQASRTVLLNLHKGTIFNSLVHGDGVSDFRVKTPGGVAAARGTVWEIIVSGDNVTIKVLRGQIAFRNRYLISEGGKFSTNTFVLVALTPAEEQEIVSFLTSAGFNVSYGNGATGGGQGQGGSGTMNPGNTTSKEQ